MSRFRYALLALPHSLCLGFIGMAFWEIVHTRSPQAAYGDLESVFVGAGVVLVSLLLWPVIGHPIIKLTDGAKAWMASRFGLRPADQSGEFPKRCPRCEAIIYAHDCQHCGRREPSIRRWLRMFGL